jgi:hypothetical protein
VKQKTDTHNVSSIALNSENNNSRDNGACNGSNGPEQRHAVQHLAERLARLVTQIQALAELGAAGAVDGANVLNVGVDAGAEGRALGKRGDTARGGNLHDAQNVHDDELDTDGEEHRGRGHGEDTDWRVVGTGAAVVC